MESLGFEMFEDMGMDPDEEMLLANPDALDDELQKTLTDLLFRRMQRRYDHSAEVQAKAMQG